MGQEMQEAARRPMKTEALGEWKIDPVTGGAVLVKAIGPAPDLWLRWVAPFIEREAMGVLCAEPIVKRSNIAGSLRVSERYACILVSRGELVVNRDAYRTWTSLAEVWNCRAMLDARRNRKE